jgi:hypothetical protein
MPSCPGCTRPIGPTEILCYRCYHEDTRVKWPSCQRCAYGPACGESWYVLCRSCWYTQQMRLHYAAVPIQSLARMVLAKKKLKKHKSAKAIQAHWRGYLVRSQLALA